MTGSPAASPWRRIGGAVRRATGATPSGAPSGSSASRTAPARAGSGASGTGSRSERLDAVLAAAEVPASVPGGSRRPVTVALLASEALRAGLAVEADVVPLDPSSSGLPQADLVLVEVQAGRAPGASDADLGALAALAADGPLVLWVTDPTLDGPLGSGLEQLARVARTVLVVDEPGAAAWRAAVPGAEVDVLAPGVQPRFHPPAPAEAPVDDPDAPRRLAAACVVLDPPVDGTDPASTPDDGTEWPTQKSALAQLDVWPVQDAAGQVRPAPPSLAGRVARPVPASTAVGLAGRYRVLLDAGRRHPGSTGAVLGAAAAQTAVVTTPAQHATLPADLQPHVAVGTTGQELGGELNGRIAQPELRDREGLRLQRAVLAGHTLGHRLDTLLDRVGAPQPARDRSISAVVPTNRDHELDNVFANLGRQVHPDVQLVLVLHGLDVDEPALRARAEAAGVRDLVVVPADKSLTLGACMNLGVAASDGRYVAKMDDDNHYGAHYLSDLVAAFDYTDASIVGKWAHYVWLRSTGAVVLRQPASEHTYERRVQGGSMLFDAALLAEVPFSDIPRAVDSDVLDRSMAHGARVYSADRFNFVSVRGTDRHAHTWTVADHTFMTRTGRLTFFGDPREHVDV
ncbi:hypothetical protein GCM10027446_18610 [Angustibacter peucedani]